LLRKLVYIEFLGVKIAENFVYPEVTQTGGVMNTFDSKLFRQNR